MAKSEFSASEVGGGPVIADGGRRLAQRYHYAMPPDLRDLIGYVAAILTTVAFFPQVLKSWRSRDLAGVSLTMYSLFTVGVALWLVYGVMLGSWPIIIGNLVTLVLAGVVLVLKVLHK